MYNLQGTGGVPHGKMSLLNSVTIACSCCQMTWQVVPLDKHFPLFGNAADFSGSARWAKLWASWVNTGSPSWDAESLWVAECFVLPKPGGRTGLVLALQNGGIWLPVPAGMSFSLWLTVSWYCPTPSYALSPAGASLGSQRLVTCRGSHPNKHVSTCWNPVDVSETWAWY